MCICHYAVHCVYVCECLSVYVCVRVCVQEMKLIEYMYRSQIPQILKIIDIYNKSIQLRRMLIGRQHQVVATTTLGPLSLLPSMD